MFRLGFDMFENKLNSPLSRQGRGKKSDSTTQKTINTKSEHLQQIMGIASQALFINSHKKIPTILI